MAVSQRWMNGNDRGVDNDLYKDFLEIFPLMETFMEHRRSQASLIVTPAPVRQRPDRKPLQKVEVVNGQSKEDNRPRRSRPGVYGDTHTPRQPLNHYMSWNGCEDPEQSQKQSFQDMLDNVSHESDSVPEGRASQQYSDEFVQEVLEENNKLRAMLKSGPWDLNETSTRMAVAEELGALRSQVTSLNRMLEAESYIDGKDHFASRTDTALLSESPVIMSGGDSKGLPLELVGRADRARRQYLAAVIAARVCKEESLLILVAELRLQLQLLFVQI